MYSSGLNVDARTQVWSDWDKLFSSGCCKQAITLSENWPEAERA